MLYGVMQSQGNAPEGQTRRWCQADICQATHCNGCRKQRLQCSSKHAHQCNLPFSVISLFQSWRSIRWISKQPRSSNYGSTRFEKRRDRYKMTKYSHFSGFIHSKSPEQPAKLTVKVCNQPIIQKPQRKCTEKAGSNLIFQDARSPPLTASPTTMLKLTPACCCPLSVFLSEACLAARW